MNGRMWRVVMGDQDRELDAGKATHLGFHIKELERRLTSDEDALNFLNRGTRWQDADRAGPETGSPVKRRLQDEDGGRGRGPGPGPQRQRWRAGGGFADPFGGRRGRPWWLTEWGRCRQWKSQRQL